MTTPGCRSHEVACASVFVSNQKPDGSMVLVSVLPYALGRRVFVSTQFHVPSRNCIELKLGFSGGGIGVVSICAIAAVPTRRTATNARTARTKLLCICLLRAYCATGRVLLN